MTDSCCLLEPIPLVSDSVLKTSEVPDVETGLGRVMVEGIACEDLDCGCESGSGFDRDLALDLDLDLKSELELELESEMN